MPVILPSEQVPGYPYPLVQGLNPTIGWNFRPPAKGGPGLRAHAPHGSGHAESHRRLSH